MLTETYKFFKLLFFLKLSVLRIICTTAFCFTKTLTSYCVRLTKLISKCLEKVIVIKKRCEEKRAKIDTANKSMYLIQLKAINIVFIYFKTRFLSNANKIGCKSK